MVRSGSVDQVVVTVNGVASALARGTTIGQLLAHLGVIPDRVAVEVNLSVIDRSAFAVKALEEEDRVEIVSFVGGGGDEDRLRIASLELTSRLIVGTGKFKDFAETKRVIDASGADMVTVAVRRVNILDRDRKSVV